MLEQTDSRIDTERSTTRAPLDDDAVRALLGTVDRVVVARGRKTDELAAEDVTPDDLKGRTGKVRAPLLAVGDTLLVGFHAETVDDLLRRE